MSASSRPKRYKRYLGDANIQVPKRTRNYWIAKNKEQGAVAEDYMVCDETNGVEANVSVQRFDEQEEFFEDAVEDSEDSSVLDKGGNEIYKDAVEDKPTSDDIGGSPVWEEFWAEDFSPGADDMDGNDQNVDDEGEFYEDAIQGAVNEEEFIILDNPENAENEESPPLYNGATITESVSTIAIMSFALRHSLSKAAIQDLLKLINIHLPVACLPETIFLFSKYFNDTTDDVTFHAYCKDCGSYLGTDDVLACTVCETVNVSHSDLVKEGFYFITLSLASQIKDLLETPSISRYFVGDTARKLEIIWNCDGMPAFQSGKGSVWPIQCMVKALPPQLRKKHMIIQSLWFGKSKPDFSTFLKPFIEECKLLSDNGVAWTNNFSGVQCNTRVFATACACDSVARCQLQGISQFNGHFGCAWCLHEGNVVPKGRGYVMTYPYEHPPPEKRTQRGMEEQAIRLATGLTHGEGVKQVSPLLLLPHFQIVDGFPVDYMHAVCEGVCEQLLNLWFDRTHHTKAWFVGNSLDEIDERIETISPPSDVTRLPRSPAQRAHWKASEFRSWLLFYCLPVLKGILPGTYLAHILLLVHAVWILLQETVRDNDISICEVILIKFVIQMKELYGEENVSYNVHLLVHLCDTVRQWGPLWSSSCFPFEGYNRKLKSLFHGTRYVQAQIAHNFSLLRFLRGRIERLPANTPQAALKCVEELLRGYPIIVKAISLTEGNHHILLVGSPQHYEPELPVKVALQTYFDVPVPSLTLHKFSSAIVNGRNFSAAKPVGRRQNCYISYNSSNVGEIKAIVRVRILGSDQVVFVISQKRVKSSIFGTDRQTGADAGHITEISHHPQEMYVIKPVKHDYLKCVTAAFNNKTYCMKLPNGIELD